MGWGDGFPAATVGTAVEGMGVGLFVGGDVVGTGVGGGTGAKVGRDEG